MTYFLSKTSILEEYVIKYIHRYISIWHLFMPSREQLITVILLVQFQDINKEVVLAFLKTMYLNISLFNEFDRLLTAFIAEYIYNGSKPLWYYKSHIFNVQESQLLYHQTYAWKIKKTCICTLLLHYHIISKNWLSWSYDV